MYILFPFVRAEDGPRDANPSVARTDRPSVFPSFLFEGMMRKHPRFREVPARTTRDEFIHLSFLRVCLRSSLLKRRRHGREMPLYQQNQSTVGANLS